jgi:hypothetical protein
MHIYREAIGGLRISLVARISAVTFGETVQPDPGCRRAHLSYLLRPMSAHGTGWNRAAKLGFVAELQSKRIADCLTDDRSAALILLDFRFYQ